MKPDFDISEELNSFTCIAEDEKGMMWFGTASGIITYDQTSDKWTHLITKNPERQNAYDENKVRFLQEFSSGRE